MTGPAGAGPARAEILARIRAARPQAEPPPVPRDYHAAGTHADHGLADLLALPRRAATTAASSPGW